MNKLNDKVLVWTDLESLEEEAVQQLRNLSELPFIFKHVAVMPDCHVGKGATVGTVLATDGAIIPAAVGVDIGCGMIAVQTTLTKNDVEGKLKSIREGIERRIPMSAGKYNSKITVTGFNRIIELERLDHCVDLDSLAGNWREQIGTLGGGNHFIELALDERDCVWVLLHSGSRGIGNKIGVHYIDTAKKLMELYHIELADKDLAYLPEGTDEFHNYMKDLHWAQEFARLNRDEMMDRVMTELSYQLYGEDGHQEQIEKNRINCHHNFTQKENHFGYNVWVTRKGAIQAREGMWGLIPGSMGTRSYIVTGRGNPVSYCSAPHGAGRRMSRTVARKSFTMEDFDKAMEGIEHRRTDVLLDEIPGAYKDIDEVIDNASDLVNIEYTLKQIMNCKGD